MATRSSNSNRISNSNRVSNSNKNHELEKRRFKSICFCNHCGESIGLLTQGQECSSCKNRYHLNCADKITTLCTHWTTYEQSLENEQEDLEDYNPETVEIIGLHEFTIRTFKKFTFCNLCNRFVFGVVNQGFACMNCGLVTHKNCKKKASLLPGCRPFFTIQQELENENYNFKHFWVNGNVSKSRVCLECKDEVYNSNVLTGKQCSWCKCVIHDKCLAEYNKKNECCNLGDLSNLILSPANVILNNPLINLSNIEEIRKNCTIRRDPNSTPLLIFVNNRSGGQQGQSLIKKFKRFLNPIQIFDLANGGPKPG
eukprot:TRINITY_DN951_c0_g1_i2.p1 TRINITY_DN951_c0_g1~~TRINITY_DN951_c0_g1_i2.p1  ORF type:complete len:312 (+),score=82.03 TRINITY_DN951_c0_g1_i2:48-983(+)